MLLLPLPAPLLVVLVLVFVIVLMVVFVVVFVVTISDDKSVIMALNLDKAEGWHSCSVMKFKVDTATDCNVAIIEDVDNDGGDDDDDDDTIVDIVEVDNDGGVMNVLPDDDVFAWVFDSIRVRACR